MTVYADSPGQAFALNAQLDQQRAQNYMASIEANRRAQMDAWQAANRDATLRQAEQARQQELMANLALTIAGRRQQEQQHQQSRADAAATQNLNLGLAKQQQQMDLMRLLAPLSAKQQERKQAETDTDSETKRMVEAINRNLALTQLRQKLTPEAVAGMVQAASGEGYMPGRSWINPFAGGRWAFNPFSRSRATVGKQNQTMEDITGMVAGIPADFSAANTPEDYRAEAARAIMAQQQLLAPTLPGPKESAGRVTLNPQTRQYEPVLLNPLLQTQAPAPGVPAPAAPVEQAPAAPQPAVFDSPQAAAKAGFRKGQTVIVWNPARGAYRPWIME